jgi:hypothetical protein
MCVVSDAAATKKTLELTKPTLQLRVSMHWRREACGKHYRELHRHRACFFHTFWKHVGHSLAMAQHRRQGKSQNQNQIYSLERYTGLPTARRQTLSSMRKKDYARLVGC